MIVSTTIVVLFVRKIGKRYYKKSFIKKKPIDTTEFTEIEFLGI